MTSSNSLKKLVSIGAAMLLAVGGSLVATQPALAATVRNTASIDAQGSSVGSSVVSVSIASCGYGFGAPIPLTTELQDFTVLVNGSAATLVSGALNGSYIALTLSSPMAAGDLISVAYSKQNGTINCFSGGDTVGSFSAVTLQQPAAPAWQVVSPDVTSVSDTGATLNFTNDTTGGFTWTVRLASSATPTNLGNIYMVTWNALDVAHASNAAAITANVLKTVSVTGLIAGTDYKAYVKSTNSNQQLSSSVLVITFRTTGTAPGGGTVSGGTSSTPTVVAESAKPLPVWAAPILKQIPTLSKTLTTDGGKIALTDGDFSSLKSVTVGGKEVAYSIDAKGDVNIPVPAGKGGTTADLVVVFTGGKMTVQDGIKYVEPTNVAAVREAPIAGFKGNSTKITGALAESIQYAAQLDKKANTVLCTGYAASKAAVATATARAEAACGYATKVNDLLVNKMVTIVVNAKLAKTAAVGIKVYK
jgi:hypothetical protein